jgi:hypothetical protein
MRRRKMNNRLPRPDSHQRSGARSDDEGPGRAPTVVFAMGPPSPEVDRLSDAILDLRPGLLIVLATD